jgi:hypothetical protein
MHPSGDYDTSTIGRTYSITGAISNMLSMLPHAAMESGYRAQNSYIVCMSATIDQVLAAFARDEDLSWDFTVEEGTHWLYPKKVDYIDFNHRLGMEERKQIIEARKSGKSISPPIPITVASYGLSCTYCDLRDYVTDGFTIKAITPCPHPDGIMVQTSLHIPSGRMMVANYIPEFDIEDDYNVNKLYEMAAYTEAMAADGMCSHFFVGNSCPTVYRSDNKLSVAAAYTEDGETNTLGDEVAGVITDLWWVTIVDGDEYDKRGCTAEADEVIMLPGTYTVESYAALRSFDRDAPVCVFANITQSEKTTT